MQSELKRLFAAKARGRFLGNGSLSTAKRKPDATIPRVFQAVLNRYLYKTFVVLHSINCRALLYITR